MKRAHRPRLVTPLFVLVTLSTFAYFVSVGALQPTLPLYVEGPLGGTNVSVGLAIGAFSLSAVLVRPWVGRLSDTKGRRILIVAGAAIVAVSIVGFLLIDDLMWLLILRFLSGFGEACFYVGAASVINDLAPDERRGEALSYFSLALYGGLALGPVLGEIALGDGRFALAWWVAAGAAALAAVLGVPIPDTRPDEITKPARGLARIVHPAGLLPGAVLAASIVGLGGFSAFVPLYALQIGLSGSRLVFATFSIVVLLIRSLGAQIPDRLGPSRSARTALLCQTTGLVVLGLWQVPFGLYTGTVILAMGQALIFPALMTLALGNAPPSERGAVVGTFTAFFDLAFGLGTVLLGVVAELFGYGGSFLASAVVAFSGFALITVRSLRAGRDPRA